MALIRHSTENPVELGLEIISIVAQNHIAIIGKFSQDDSRKKTGNARSAVTKPSTIPPWAR
jgi:hypothetical protein